MYNKTILPKIWEDTCLFVYQWWQWIKNFVFKKTQSLKQINYRMLYQLSTKLCDF